MPVSAARKASDGSEQKKAPTARKRTTSSKATSSSAQKKAAPKKAAPKKAAPKKAAAKKSPAKKGSPAQAKPAAEPTPVESAAAPQPADAEAATGPDVAFDRIVAFHLGGQRYAVPIDAVQEIQQIVAFSEVPASGGAVVGMVNLRGTVIPALDARVLIGLAPEEFHVDTPMVICRAHGQLVALIVDDVEDVLDMPEGCMQGPPAMHNLASKMIGVCRMDDDLLYVLDVEALVVPADVGAG